MATKKSSKKQEPAQSPGCCCAHEYPSQQQGQDGQDSCCSHGHEDGAVGGAKIILPRLICAAILLAAGLVVRMPAPAAIWVFGGAYVLAGYDIVWRALGNIVRGQIFDENFLMSIASLGALAIGQHPEAAAVMLFYQTGEFLQAMAVGKSRRQIKALLAIKAEFANLRTATGLVRVSPETVNVGDLIIVKAGEKIPLDGEIVEGSTTVDMSALTGESLPQDLGAGNAILSGAVNLTGLILVRVTKPYRESTVAKILYLVEKVASKKAVTENFISKFAKVYTPIVVGLAALIALVPPLLISGTLDPEWLYKGLVFLVVSCPCALVLSIPLSYFAGLGCASKHGILIKGGNYLEALARAEIAVFDKTGTLTEGTFAVQEIIAQENFSADEVLAYVAAGEYFSNHPIALSVKALYQGNPDEAEMSAYTEVAGQGISMVYRHKSLLIGSARFLAESNIAVAAAKAPAGTVLYLAVDGMHAGSLLIADTIKKNARADLEELAALGIKKTVMLTGDRENAALAVQQQLGLDATYHSLLPQDKLEKLEQLAVQKSKQGKLLFVGDGLNDAPVLMRADIGFAMGGVGSEAAIESADVVIMNDALAKIGESIEIAKNTKRVVWQNITIALGIKMLVMVVSVITYLPMYLAVFADVGVAILAVLNAMRALTFTTRHDKIVSGKISTI